VAQESCGPRTAPYKTRCSWYKREVLYVQNVSSGCAWLSLRPWRLQQYVPTERQETSTGLRYDVSSQEMVLFVVTAVIASNLIIFSLSFVFWCHRSGSIQLSCPPGSFCRLYRVYVEWPGFQMVLTVSPIIYPAVPAVQFRVCNF
jgi:hypothetical protein